MIPFWVRWVEVAQFPDAGNAEAVQQWLERDGIAARVRAHHGEPRGNVGTSVGYQILPDRAPVPHRYTVEVKRVALTQAHELLRAEGWDSSGYEAHWWLSQSIILAGFAVSAVILVALAVSIAGR